MKIVGTVKSVYVHMCVNIENPIIIIFGRGLIFIAEVFHKKVFLVLKDAMRIFWEAQDEHCFEALFKIIFRSEQYNIILIQEIFKEQSTIMFQTCTLHILYQVPS